MAGELVISLKKTQSATQMLRLCLDCRRWTMDRVTKQSTPPPPPPPAPQPHLNP